MAEALAEYQLLKEAGLPISDELVLAAFGPQPVGNSRQGGDTAATATAVGALPYTDSGTTVGYAGDIGPFVNTGLACAWSGWYSAVSSGAGPDVFYSWTVTTADIYTISLCGSGYDTVLGVFQDLGGGVVGAQVLGNDDSCSLQSSVTCASLPVGNYFVVVDSYGATSTGGAYTLNISGTGGVSPCDDAPVAVCGGSYTDDTTGAPNIAGNLAPDHVYVFNSTQPQILTLSLCGGSTWDTALHVYDDCPNVGTELAYNDDFCGLQSQLDYVVGVGTYYILVEGYGSNFGPYTLNVTCTTCIPINCTGIPESESNNTAAEADVLACGETACGTTYTYTDGISNFRDLDFYEVLLPSDGIVTANLDVQDFDGILWFVDSDGNTILNSINAAGFCQDETLVSPCVQAGVYYVLVSSTVFTGLETPVNYGLSITCETCVHPCDSFSITPITLPYTGTGSNVGAPDVLGSDAGDVGYSFTLTELSSVNFTSCLAGTSYDSDSYLYLGDPCNGGTLLFSNDGDGACAEATSTWASHWFEDCGLLEAGDYTLVLSGYLANEGSFEFSISAASCACPPINCTGTAESETNDTAAEADGIACGQTVCGTTFTYTDGVDNFRDVDFFELLLANDAIVTATMDVENFDGILYFVGSDGETVLSFADANGFCTDETLVTSCLPAGVYYLVPTSTVFTGLETPVNYGLTVSCETCTYVSPCEAAIEFVCGTTGNYSSALSTGNTWDTYCLGGETGPEVIFSFDHPGGNLAITLSSATADANGDDLDMALLGSCDPLDCLDMPYLVGSTESIAGDYPAGTYYLVVDAWNWTGLAYDFDLSIDCNVVFEYGTCQIAALNGEGGTLATSEIDVEGTNLLRADRFGGVVGSITAIDFNGAPMYYLPSWANCVEDPIDFTFTFYDTDMNVVETHSASLTGVISELIGTFQTYDYHFDMPTPLALAEGYVAIQGAGDNLCWFLWVSSPTGADGASLLATDGVWAPEAFDLNYCFTVGAAPCDPVVDLTITKAGPNVNLNWTATAGAVSYNVYESVDAYTLGALVANVPATTTSISIVGAKKFYIVTAVCP